MIRIMGVTVALLLMATGGLAYTSLSAYSEIGRLEQSNEQWVKSYEYLSVDRMRIDAESRLWRKRNDEASQRYEGRIRALGRYKAIVEQDRATKDIAVVEGGVCLDSAIPTAVSDLLRRHTPSTD